MIDDFRLYDRALTQEEVTCAGTFHPTRVAVVLIVDEKDVRSRSPERGYGFLGYQPEQKQIRLLQPPDSAEYVFDVRPLRGKTARIELRDLHGDGCFFKVKGVATDRKPVAGTKLITSVARWAADSFETTGDSQNKEALTAPGSRQHLHRRLLQRTWDFLFA